MTIPRYKWQPTTLEIAAAAGIDPADVIRFDHNTTPWPTGWAVELVSEAAATLNEYPGASYLGIREAAAGRHGLEPEQIMPGAGADELILLAARAFLRPGQRSAMLTPTYPLYRIACAQVGAQITEVAAEPPSFEFPIDAMLAAARDAEVVWLCVPNNPTGVDIVPEVVEAVIAATDGVVVVDAAYAEFTGADWAEPVERHSNLIVLRTLSKAFALAGARVGYAMAHPSLVDRLDAVRPPGSISSISVELARLVLGRPELAARAVKELEAARRRLAVGLAAVGFRVLPSAANFLLCEVGPTAMDLAASLRGRGMVVRTFGAETALGEYLRFTVRSPEQNEQLLGALGEVLL